MLIQTAEQVGDKEADDETPIKSGGFWPEIVPEIARDSMRLDSTVTAIRLRAALIEAIAHVNSQLAEWRRAKQAAGFATLAAVPAEDVDGKSINVQRWERAVFCLAAANVTERYRSFDSTGSGLKKADELDPTIEDLRRDSAWAINDIAGVGRSTIELI